MRILILLLVLCIEWTALEGREGRLEEQKRAYFKALEEQVVIAETRAASYLSKMQHNPQVSKQFKEANLMVQVKKSLLARFRKSKSIDSPAVRWQLLEVMKKENITEEDLTTLQQRVNAVVGIRS